MVSKSALKLMWGIVECTFWQWKGAWEPPRLLPGHSQDAPFDALFLCVTAVNWDVPIWIFFNEIADYLIGISFFFPCFFCSSTISPSQTVFAKWPDCIGFFKPKARVQSWENIFLKKGCIFNAMELKQETACFLWLKYNTIEWSEI